MKQAFSSIVFVISIYLGLGLMTRLAIAEEEKAKTCTMEKQCRWENFKKICVYVKVCR